MLYFLAPAPLAREHLFCRCGKEVNNLLNKQETEQVKLFLATMADVARELLDEIAMFEAELSENEQERKRRATDRKLRNKRRTANRQKSHADSHS